MSTKTSRGYTTDLLSIPGMKFNVDIDDPKERIQAYLDEYATPLHPDGHEEVFYPSLSSIIHHTHARPH
jgi:hypothetical protein